MRRDDIHDWAAVDSSIEGITDSMGSGMRARYLRFVTSIGGTSRLGDRLCLSERRFGSMGFQKERQP
jgi:hypothetical protein